MAANYIVLDTADIVLVGSLALFPGTNDPTRMIIEDGTGVPGANSYVSLVYANGYFVGRRLYSNAWIVASNDVKEAALRQASTLLDAEFIWSGTTPVNVNQGLAWPFTDATDRYHNLVLGIPKALKDAVCEVAMYLLAEDRLVDAQGNGFKSIKVDVITLVFDKSENPSTYPPIVTRLLYGLGATVRGSGALKNIKLYRV